jgi:hypothetical protein
MKAKISKVVILAVTMLLLFAAVQPAAAQESSESVEVTGTITAITPPTETQPGTIAVDTGDSLVTLYPGLDFDYTSLEPGMQITAAATQNEDGSLTVTEITITDSVPPEEPLVSQDGYYCTQSDEMHPFGARLVDRYGMDYATLQDWFCSGFGWGQVMLALQTATITSDDPNSLLDARSAGQGWGEIWQELGLIGKSDKKDDKPEVVTPNQAAKEKDDKGKPDHDNPPGNQQENPGLDQSNGNKDKDKDKDKEKSRGNDD